MEISYLKRISIAGGFSIMMILATITAAFAAADFTPGKLPVARGTIEVTTHETTARLNPNRPLRVLEYQLGSRQAYREGDWDYYNRRKIAREETKPAWGAGIQGMITGKKAVKFTKTAPQLHPYETGSGLRPTIKTMPVKNPSAKLNVIKSTSSTTSQGGE